MATQLERDRRERSTRSSRRRVVAVVVAVLILAAVIAVTCALLRRSDPNSTGPCEAPPSANSEGHSTPLYCQ